MTRPSPPSGSPNDTQRHARRMAALQAEITALGEVSLRSSIRHVINWTESILGDGPFAIIKRKADRFRLPRAMKTDLIDRFVGDDVAGTNAITTLLVVAHPDDESIGAGARLSKLGDAWIVEVTDGAPRDIDCAQRHGYRTPDEYKEARQRELEHALQIAGFPLERLIALGFNDGETTLRLAELCLRVTEVIDSIRPQVVLTHPYEGGHTDHDATAFAVHLACGVLRREGITPPAILELALYNAQDGQKVVQQFLPHEGADRDQRVVRLSGADRLLKGRIFGAFASQEPLLKTFSTEFERFRPAPRYVFTLPPHAGQLNYERYGQHSWAKSWREHAEQVLRTLGMRRD